MTDIRPSSADLQFDLPAPPKQIVESIRDYVTLARDERRTLDEDRVAGLAVTLGEQYVRQFGWDWNEVTTRTTISTSIMSPVS